MKRTTPKSEQNRQPKARSRIGAATRKPLREVRTSPEARELSEETIATTIENYDPTRGATTTGKKVVRRASSELWSRVGDEVKAIVGEATRTDPSIRVAMALSTLTGFIVWAEQEHLGLTPRALVAGPMAAANIDSYAARLAKAGGSRRYTLRKIASAINPELTRSSISIGKPQLQQPYSVDEIEELLERIQSLTNAHRRRVLLGMVALGAGAGLVRGMQRGVCKNDVHHHSDRSEDELYVRHNGICRPVHPLLRSALLEMPEDEQPLTGTAQGKNYLSRANTWLNTTADTTRITPDRLRAFYAVWLLSSGRPLQDVLSILGLKKPGSLEAYLEFLPKSTLVCSE
jgi:integrase